MKHQPRSYQPSKKPKFYCDEDFPYPSLNKLKRFKIKHATLDCSFQGREDEFHYDYAFQNRSILITLDDDYLDNRKFKINKTWGVIVIRAGQFSSWERVNQVLDKLVLLMKDLEEESLRSVKITVSLEGYSRWSLDNNKVKREDFKW